MLLKDDLFYSFENLMAISGGNCELNVACFILIATFLEILDHPPNGTCFHRQLANYNGLCGDNGSDRSSFLSLKYKQNGWSIM